MSITLLVLVSTPVSATGIDALRVHEDQLPPASVRASSMR
jgi:hypothetical protein